MYLQNAMKFFVASHYKFAYTLKAYSWKSDASSDIFIWNNGPVPLNIDIYSETSSMALGY